MKSSSNILSYRLRIIMDRNNVSLGQLSNSASVSQASLMNYLKNGSGIGLQTLLNIADFFNVPLDYFLDRVDDETAEKMLDDQSAEFELRRKVAYENYLNCGRRRMLLHDSLTETPWPYNMIEAIYDHECETTYPARVIDSFEEHLMSPEVVVPEKTKGMLLMYFKELKNLDEIGRTYDLTRERIRQRIKKGLRMLRKPMFTKYLLRDDEKIQKEINGLKEEASRLRRDIEGIISEKEYYECLLGGAKEKVVKATNAPINELTLDELDLSVRSYNCLHRVGCDTLFDIITYARDGKLTQIRNLGKHSEQEILEMIKLKTGIDYRYKKEA